jgi:hypothetical protein
VAEQVTVGVVVMFAQFDLLLWSVRASGVANEAADLYERLVSQIA